MRRGPTALAGGLLAVGSAACGVGLTGKVDYSVRPMVVAPLGSRVTDGSKPFAELFCSTLPHTDGNWGDCSSYLETRVTPPPPVSSPIQTRFKVLLIGGAFSECFENHQLYLFDGSQQHLEKHGVVFGPRPSIDGTGTPEANAERIAKYLVGHPGEYIAIGHSKGGADLMAAVQHHDIARKSIRALVSVAGAIGGSRLADLGVRLGILGFRDAVRRAGLGTCKIEDHGGIRSLQRDLRYKAMREWTPPATLRSFSLAAVSRYKRTSRPLQTLWRRNESYSIDQDSHIIVEEAIIPDGEFLGVAKGDHWAVALPMSEHPKTKDRVNHNRFPRDALLEAIVRYTIARLGGDGPAGAASLGSASGRRIPPSGDGAAQPDHHILVR